MRTASEVQNEMWETETDIELLKGRLGELEDELIRVEDREAEEAECQRCEGNGWIDTEDEDIGDAQCLDCGGTGELQLG